MELLFELGGRVHLQLRGDADHTVNLHLVQSIVWLPRFKLLRWQLCHLLSHRRDLLVVLPGLLLGAASADVRGRQPRELLSEPHQQRGVDVLLVPDLVADVVHIVKNDNRLGNVLLVAESVHHLLRTLWATVVVAKQPAVAPTISPAHEATYIAAN